MGGTPSESVAAETSASSTVIAGGTKRGNVHAGVASSAPGSAGQKRTAVAAVVGGSAARRNTDAFQLSGAPSLSGRANAHAGGAVVVSGTGSRDIRAFVGGIAPGSA